MYKSTRCKLGEAVTLKFQITQHSRYSNLMKKLITNLGCGRIELNKERSAVYFLVTKFNDILQKIIPFFEKYPLEGLKSLDFACFKKVAELMKDKADMTE
jgi:hypothetical protein